MKIYIVTIILFTNCFEGTLFSQNSFFIRLNLYNKVTINTQNQNRFISFSDGTQIIYYTRYKNSWPDNSKRLIGLTTGYNFNRFIFETGILSENSRISGRMSILIGTNAYGRYQVFSIIENSGISNLRFPLRIYYHISNTNNKQRFNALYFFAGVDILTPSFDAWGKSPVWDLWQNEITDPNSNGAITYQYGPIHNNVVTIAPSLGVLIKLKYKNRIEICNLQLDWHFNGFKAMGSHKAVFTNANGESYTVYNKLSAQGIIFKLSRDINFKRLRNYKR